MESPYTVERPTSHDIAISPVLRVYCPASSSKRNQRRGPGVEPVFPRKVDEGNGRVFDPAG